MSATKKKLGVIGWPIDHSLSPIMHKIWLEQHGLPISYNKIAVKPEHLRDFLTSLEENNFCGINLTVPHKQAAYIYACERGLEITATAHQACSVNMIKVEKGLLQAGSTDGEGFLKNLQRSGLDWRLDGRHIILGAGGAAVAIATRLVSYGVRDLSIINRSPDRARHLMERVKKQGAGDVELISWQHRAEALEDAVMLIQATSLGMQGQPALDLDLSALPRDAIVADIVYRPLATKLLEQAMLRGNPTLDGLGMLMYQAQLSFKHWFGLEPEVGVDLIKALKAYL